MVKTDTAYSAENGRLSATKTAGCPGQIGHPKLGVGGWGLGGVGLGGVGLDLV